MDKAHLVSDACTSLALLCFVAAYMVEGSHPPRSRIAAVLMITGLAMMLANLVLIGSGRA